MDGKLESDTDLNSRITPDKFWKRAEALGVKIWERNGESEFTEIAIGINDEVALKLNLIPIDNCDISFGFEFNPPLDLSSLSLVADKARNGEFVRSLEEWENLLFSSMTTGELPFTINDARDWQQQIDAARALAEDGYARVAAPMTGIFWRCMRKFGMETYVGTAPEIFDSSGITIKVNETIGLQIARFEQDQCLSAKLVKWTHKKT